MKTKILNRDIVSNKSRRRGKALVYSGVGVGFVRSFVEAVILCAGVE